MALQYHNITILIIKIINRKENIILLKLMQNIFIVSPIANYPTGSKEERIKKQ